MDYISERIKKLTESGTIAMAQKSRELASQGHKIINFTLGEPDFNIPDFIKESAKKAIDDNYSKYPPVSGFPELKTAICNKLKRDNNGDYNPNQIIVSTGAKHSLMNVILSVINPGDEVIIFSPYWVSYEAMIEYAGGKVVIVEGKIENDFNISPTDFEKKITNKTKAVIINSPSNPSGAVYSYDMMKAYAEIIKKNKHVLLISDEIYEHINFKSKTTSICEFPEIKDQTIIINGLSKSFAMTGWRLGFMAGPVEIAKACEKLQGQYTSGAASIVQRAAIDAFNTDPEKISFMTTKFKERRDLIVSLIKEIKGVKYNIPEGAFYLFPDISYYFGKNFNGKKLENSYDIAMFLLSEQKVSIVSGESFGAKNNIRISYATSNENIIEGIKRIKDGLEKLK